MAKKRENMSMEKAAAERIVALAEIYDRTHKRVATDAAILFTSLPKRLHDAIVTGDLTTQDLVVAVEEWFAQWKRGAGGIASATHPATSAAEQRLNTGDSGEWLHAGDARESAGKKDTADRKTKPRKVRPKAKLPVES